MTKNDERWLRAAFELARRAHAHGDEPYGAVLVDAAGELLLEGANTVVTERDVTGHAETNLVRAASARVEPEVLAGCTMYASTEPCAMCAGAIYWSGIGRLVFGLSNARLYGEVLDLDASAKGLRLACREVLVHGGRPVEVVGPLLEDEAAEAVSGAAGGAP
jgi:tRNA(Arg) A34 adenosine deaminase TadA